VIDHATVTRRIDRRTVARPVQKAPSKRKYAIGAAIALPVLLIGGFVAWKQLGGRSGGGAGSIGGFPASRVAVMYFDAGGSKQLTPVAEGLTETLIDQLSQVEGLDVVSKGGAAMFKGSNAPLDSIGKVLAAGTLVRGSVDDAGDKLRVSVVFVDGNSGANIESESFDQPKQNLLAARDSLAAKVATYLRGAIGKQVEVREQRSATNNVAAWTLLQRALKLKRDGEDQASKADTAASQRSFADADALLAQAEPMDSKWVDPISERSGVALAQAAAAGGALAAKPFIENGIGHANRALALDPRNADALDYRGKLKYAKWRYALAANPREAKTILNDAQTDLKAAVAAKPSKASAWAQLSQIYNQQDDFTQAKLAAMRAYEEDAFLNGTDKVLWRLYATSYDLEQFPDAVKYCDEGGRRFPTNPLFVRCRLWLLTTTAVAKPDIPAAWRDYAKLQGLSTPKEWVYQQHEAKMLIGAGLAKAGLQDSARKLLVSARADKTADPTGELLSIEAFIRTLFNDPKDTDESFRLLQSYLSANPAHQAGLAESQSWWWKRLKQDPRFAELVAGAR
jgi:serine/threonine-protein kinase